MYLDYTKIKSGQKKQPMLRLRTLAGKELGVVPFVHDLQFEINYSDISTISFTTPYMVNGLLNPLYAAISSFEVVYTDELGIYVLASPKKSGDGVKEVKTVTGYSLEQMFRKKNMFLKKEHITSGTRLPAKIPFLAGSLSLTRAGALAMWLPD